MCVLWLSDWRRERRCLKPGSSLLRQGNSQVLDFPVWILVFMPVSRQFGRDYSGKCSQGDPSSDNVKPDLKCYKTMFEMSSKGVYQSFKKMLSQNYHDNQ